MCRKSLIAGVTILILSVFLHSAGSGCEGLTGQSGQFNKSISSGGWLREFILYVPPSYTNGKKTPLVFVFHGFRGTPGAMLTYTEMDSLANEKNFIVVVPKGSGPSNALSWNAGTCCGFAETANVDDVTFVSDMIDLISSEYCIDPARIFATGFSNGAMMSYRLACELSDRIAAVAPVAGDIRLAECNPQRLVPGIGFHGTADAVIPYSWALASVEAAADLYQCSNDTEAVYQYGEVTCVAYKGCAQGAAAEFCTVDGGGHNWPGARDLCKEDPVSCVWYGHTTQDIDASLAMWQFFTAHAMPGDTIAMPWLPLLLFDGQ